MKLDATGLRHTVAGRTLYRGLDVSVQPGKLTAVIGPNGSGKSTLLRELVGLSDAQHGTIEIDGRPLPDLPHRERALCIAYLPQNTALYYDMPVRSVVMLGRAPYLPRFGQPSDGDDREVAAALAQVELNGLAERGVMSLSGGERQRVMLARMLATRSPILVLDEPTTALDIGHALAFLDLCRDLTAQGRAIVIAMHELELARRYADAVLLLSGHGESRFGEPAQVMSADVLEQVFHVRVREHHGGISFFSARASQDGLT